MKLFNIEYDHEALEKLLGGRIDPAHLTKHDIYAARAILSATKTEKPPLVRLRNATNWIRDAYNGGMGEPPGDRLMKLFAAIATAGALLDLAFGSGGLQIACQDLTIVTFGSIALWVR